MHSGAKPAHLRAIIAIHACADLHRGVVSLGGTGSGFWMRADWGPRMAAYNLMPPLWQDGAGRWAKAWAEHLEGNAPWLEAFSTDPGFDDFWRSRVADIARITCPTFQIGGWRDLYADCTPRDFCAITASKKLLMGAWKHEFPDTGREAPAAGCRNRWSWSVCPPPSAGDARSPDWGPLQSAVLDSPNDLGGAQTWDIHRDLMNDAVRLAATRIERVRVDGQTELQIDHAYGATVAAARPDLARMQSTTTVRLNQAAGMTELSCRTLATAHDASVDVTIHVDGQPFWQRHWHFYGPAK